MPKVHVLLGNEKSEFYVDNGTIANDFLINNNYKVNNHCGGQGTCGKCKINVNGSNVLACQFSINEDITIKLSEAENTISASTVLNNENVSLLFDLGTTTVRCKVISDNDYSLLDDKTIYNKQISCGSDVLSRIIYSEKHGTKVLQDKIIDTINELITLLKVNPDKISKIIIAGNTIITHTLYNVDCSTIRRSPYKPNFLSKEIIKAKSIGINASVNTELYTFPLISGFVGGDIVSGLYATALNQCEKLTLYIDFGTNGEIVLGNKDWLLCTAASCGPAFEGAGIECGMLANSGAIVDIEITENKFKISTIDNIEAKGICGSGLINIIATLYNNKYIDSKGHYVKFYPNNRLYLTNDIYISENDIENFIKAKAAIFAACETLLNKVNLTFNDLNRIILTGTFGKHINVKNAITLGMLPKIDTLRYEYLDNCSLQGTEKLNKTHNIEEIISIQKKLTSIELTDEPDYTDHYIASLFIPHTNLQLFK